MQSRVVVEARSSQTYLCDILIPINGFSYATALRRSKHHKLFYKVRWRDTWEPAKSLSGCANTATEEFRRRLE